jgi:hypothetical protein
MTVWVCDYPSARARVCVCVWNFVHVNVSLRMISHCIPPSPPVDTGNLPLSLNPFRLQTSDFRLLSLLVSKLM